MRAVITKRRRHVVAADPATRWVAAGPGLRGAANKRGRLIAVDVWTDEVVLRANVPPLMRPHAPLRCTRAGRTPTQLLAMSASVSPVVATQHLCRAVAEMTRCTGMHVSPATHSGYLKLLCQVVLITEVPPHTSIRVGRPGCRSDGLPHLTGSAIFRGTTG